MTGLEHFFQCLGLMWAYGLSAIIMLLVVLKVADWLTPKYNMEKALVEDKNLAVAVTVSALILGISAIIVAVIVT